MHSLNTRILVFYRRRKERAPEEAHPKELPEVEARPVTQTAQSEVFLHPVAAGELMEVQPQPVAGTTGSRPEESHEDLDGEEAELLPIKGKE